MPNSFELLETILCDPNQDFFLLDLHIARLLKAAADFNAIDNSSFNNIPSPEAIRLALEISVPHVPQFKRVRLLLNAEGELRVEHQLLNESPARYDTLEEAAANPTGLTVRLDVQPLESDATDPLVLHKTTHRTVYDEARIRAQCGEQSDGLFDVILWNKQGFVTESSIANIAVNMDGWKTPRITSGIIPGVFRQHLLESSQMTEHDISVEDLVTAQKNGCPIVCFNAVRKAYRVELLL